MIQKLDRATHKLRNEIRQLHRASERNERGQFLVEGPHACLEFLRAGVRPTIVVVSDDASDEVRDVLTQAHLHQASLFAASSSELTRMCTTTTSQGILMVVPQFSEAPCKGRIVALDGVSDPGNVGTIIRTAAWFGCTDVVVSDGCADVYNPKVVRSSAGALASLNVIRRASVATFLDEHPHVPSIVAVAHGGVAPSSLSVPPSWCLVVGSEAHGVSAEVLVRAPQHVTIHGHVSAVESLNAAVATAILLYELTGSA